MWFIVFLLNFKIKYTNLLMANDYMSHIFGLKKLYTCCDFLFKKCVEIKCSTYDEYVWRHLHKLISK